MPTKFWEFIFNPDFTDEQMGKKLNDLFKAASQINSLLGLCVRHFCLMFLSLLMSWSDARIIQA